MPIRILLFWLAVYPVLTAADIYRWTDADGRIFYADRPDGDDPVIIPLPGVHTGDENFEQRLEIRRRLLEVLEGERRQREQAGDERRAARAERRADCVLASSHLDNLLDSSYLYEQTDDPYNPKILTDGERISAIASARETVRQSCPATPVP